MFNSHLKKYSSNLKWFRPNCRFHTSATTPERREFGEFRAKVLPKPSLTHTYQSKFDTFTHGPAQIFRKSWRNNTISAIYIYNIVYMSFHFVCIGIWNIKISFNTYMNDINFTTSSWKCSAFFLFPCVHIFKFILKNIPGTLLVMLASAAHELNEARAHWS